jgi:SAM-dependent methyltransferase
MTRETEEKLAGSLTAETTDLLPFLPYLLQDFWEIGSEPAVMVDLISRHISISGNTKILDLACGKGAVSVKVARQLRVGVKGIDLIPEFIEVAKQKAEEHGVDALCAFAVGDVNEAVKTERDYDAVIFGAAGNVLGSPAETLDKLKAVVKPGGYILIDEGYLPDDGRGDDVRYKNYEMLTETQWVALFKDAGLELLETIEGEDGNDSRNADSGMALITARVNELIEKHPDKKAIFEGYIRSQQNEYDDMANSLVCVTWILWKDRDK